MEITGTITQMLPEKTGNGKNGTWRKQEVILETEGQYKKKICFSFWGDKADTTILRQGATVKISFDLESREFNGKWYTEAKAWRVDPAGNTNSPVNTQQPPAYQDYCPPQENTGNAGDDNLPF